MVVQMFLKMSVVGLLTIQFTTCFLYADEKIPSPFSEWSQTYLINTLFVAEYDSFLHSPSADDPSAYRESFFKSEGGLDLWIRAVFAIESAQRRGHFIPQDQNLRLVLNAHKARLKKVSPEFTKNKPYIKQAIKLSPDHLPLSVEVLNLLEQTWSSDSLKSHWKKFQDAYHSTTPICPLNAEEVAAFAKHQKKLLGEGESLNPIKLLKPLSHPSKEWSLDKVRCLALTFMATPEELKKNQGYEPLFLMESLRSFSKNIPKLALASRDLSIKTLLALRYFQKKRYPETLNVLVELQDEHPEYRLAYEIVQRIYSMVQRGQGDVALKTP